MLASYLANYLGRAEFETRDDFFPRQLISERCRCEASDSKRIMEFIVVVFESNEISRIYSKEWNQYYGCPLCYLKTVLSL